MVSWAALRRKAAGTPPSVPAARSRPQSAPQETVVIAPDPDQSKKALPGLMTCRLPVGMMLVRMPISEAPADRWA